MGKALIVTPFYPPNIGGAESFAEDFAKAISKKYVVHICTIKWDKPIIWEGMNLKKASVLIYKLAGPLLKMKNKYKYEKVYALGIIPSFLCCIFNIKFSAIILALYDFKRPNLYTFILNKADKVFVEGERGKQDMLKLGVKEDKIVKFQHWCDQSRFFYVPKNNETLKVLFTGRDIRIKGKHVIEACEKLTKGIDYEYATNVPFKDMPSHYQMADVVVVPSLYSEGFSRVVIEAASCGCVIVASNKGALPEMVSPFGKCIEPTAQNYYDVLMKLRHYKTALEKIQIHTAVYAQKNFSDKNASIFID